MAKPTADETRITVKDFEVRAKADGNGYVIRGYGAVFNSLSKDLGGFVEQVDASAFNKTLRDGGDVRSYFNHDPMYVLGRKGASTLRVAVDTHGVFYEADAPDTTWAKDLITSMQRGDINASSFSFRTIDDAWSETDQGYPLRTLKEVQLFELGPVSDPAYDAADSNVGTRALERLAESRNLTVEAVRANLAAIARGESTEQKTDEETPVETTFYVPSYRSLGDTFEIEQRLKGI